MKREIIKKNSLIILAILVISIFLSVFLEVFLFNISYFDIENKGNKIINSYIQKENEILIFEKSFIRHLILNHSAEVRVEYTLECVKNISDTNTLVESIEGSLFSEIKDEFIRVDSKCDNLKLITNTKEASIESIIVSNLFTMSLHRILYLFFFIISFSILIFFRKCIRKKVEVGYLIISFCLGLTFVLLVPVNTGMVWDDETHFPKIYQLSTFMSNAPIPASAYDMFSMKWSTIEGNFHVHKFYSENDQMIYYTLLNQKDNEIVGYSSLELGYSFTGYIFQAFGLFLAKVFKQSFTVQFFFGRFFNLLMYILTTYFSIKLTKKYKLTLAVFALFPTSIFLASSYSYDPTSIGFLMLGTVILVNEWMIPSDPIKISTLLLMYFLFFIGSYHKAIYFPFFMLLYFIPKHKFKSNKLFYLSVFMITVLIVILLSTFILPTLLNPESVVGDVRGGDVDVAGQVKFILASPLLYSRILIQNIFSTGFYNFFQYPFSNLAYLGSISNTYHWILALLFVLVFLVDHQFDNSSDIYILRYQRVILFLIYTITVVLIWTSMYVIFNPVGSTFIGGVQARYFFPLVPLLIYALKPFIRIFSKFKLIFNFNFIIYLIYDVVIFIAIYNLIVSRFWL